MAMDGMLDTYWLSKEAAGAVLEIEILTGARSVRDVQIEWTQVMKPKRLKSMHA